MDSCIAGANYRAVLRRSQVSEADYDAYANNDDFTIVQSPMDYKKMHIETLDRLVDLAVAQYSKDIELLNLIRTARDYALYLEDNRRMIV